MHRRLFHVIPKYELTDAWIAVKHDWTSMHFTVPGFWGPFGIGINFKPIFRVYYISRWKELFYATRFQDLPPLKVPSGPPMEPTGWRVVGSK